MTAPPTSPRPAGTADDPPTPPRRPITPARRAWLDSEITDWTRLGLVDGLTADRLRAHYVSRRRVSLIGLWVTLGSLFLGAGLLWVVAANLDRFAPLTRFAFVAVLWVLITVAVEWFADRRQDPEGAGRLLVEALRLLPAAAFGAVLFQAAQSLQVPAFEPLLVLCWGLGTLLYAYLVRGRLPLAAGVVLVAIWSVWYPVSNSTHQYEVMAAFLAAGLGGAGIAALHRRTPWPEAGLPWRDAAMVMTLIGMFVAALPFDDDPVGRAWAYGPILVGLLLAGAGLALGRAADRWPIALTGGAVVLGLLLAAWTIPDLYTLSSPPAQAYLRAAFAVLAYLAVAVGVALVGSLQDSQRLSFLASAALAVFMTFQAFAVFAPIMSGAVLFLTVGAVLIITGWLADRGRRRLFAGTRSHRLLRRSGPTPDQTPSEPPEESR